MTTLCLIFLSLVIISRGNYNINRRRLNTNYGTYTQSTKLLPRYCRGSAIASNNNNIFILGGLNYPHQLVQFDVGSQNFTDIGEVILPVVARGYAQYYTQIQAMLYWLDAASYGKKIIIYNLKNNSIQNNTVIPNNVGIHSCLASYKHTLYVVGGLYNGSSLNTLQIYNISSQIWDSGLPSMQIARYSLSCIVQPTHNVLYAIGGKNGHDYFSSIEKISIHDIENNQWIYVQDMTNQLAETQAIIWQDSVFIIGGTNYDVTTTYFHYSQEMLQLNGTSDEITTAASLSYKVYGTSAIIVNDKIYAFGGGIAQTIILDIWQYLPLLPTSEPTYTPTTTIPTTAIPTSTSTYTPTTTMPTTAMPTSASTPTTSNAPTSQPTSNPTKAPSKSPLDVNTNNAMQCDYIAVLFLIIMLTIY